MALRTIIRPVSGLGFQPLAEVAIAIARKCHAMALQSHDKHSTSLRVRVRASRAVQEIGVGSAHLHPRPHHRAYGWHPADGVFAAAPVDGHRGVAADARKDNPLGRVSIGKRSFRSQFSFVIRLTHCCLRRPFRTRYSNLSFRLLIPDAHRRAIACAEAVRSVTHLVLALVGR